jgi:plasmid stabilization system protein ParE
LGGRQDPNREDPPETVGRIVRAARAAADELDEAIGWYESYRRGLGAEFYAAIQETLALISEHEEAGTPVAGDPRTRRLLVARFPFQVVYRLTPTETIILAFAHRKRRPGYWQDRA